MAESAIEANWIESNGMESKATRTRHNLNAIRFI